MKKYVFLFISLLFLTLNAAIADILPSNVYVVTEKDINHSEINKNQILEFLALDNYGVDDGIIINKGDIVKVKIKDYVKPKRGKRNGYYKIEYIGDNGTLSGTMKVSTPKDLKDIAKSAGISITGHILKVPGFSQAIAVSKGLISPNQDESRLKSAGKNLYESTPLTYIEKGSDFCVEKDGIIVLKLKPENNDNE